MKLRKISYTQVPNYVTPQTAREKSALRLAANCPHILWYIINDNGTEHLVAFAGSVNKTKGCRPNNFYRNHMASLRKRNNASTNAGVPDVFITKNKKTQDIVWGHFADVFGVGQVRYWSESNLALNKRTHKSDYFMKWHVFVEFIRPDLERLLVDYVVAPVKEKATVTPITIKEPEKLPEEVREVLDNLTSRVDNLEINVQTNAANVESVRAQTANVLHALSETERNAWHTAKSFADSIDIEFSKRIIEEIEVNTLKWVKDSNQRYDYSTIGGKNIYRFRFQDLYECTKHYVNQRIYEGGVDQVNNTVYRVWHPSEPTPNRTTKIRQDVGRKTGKAGYRPEDSVLAGKIKSQKVINIRDPLAKKRA